MKKFPLILGVAMAIAGYFWYKSLAGDAKLLDIISRDFLSKPEFAPLVVIILGIASLLYGITSPETYNR